MAGIPPRAGGASGHKLGNWASEAKRRCEMKTRFGAPFLAPLHLEIIVLLVTEPEGRERGVIE